MPTINNNNMNERYENRVLAKEIQITTNSRITGLNNNVLVIGGSGSGKTGGYVIPNIQNAVGSLCVCDTKNQLERHYGRMLMSKGYKVMKLDLVNMEQSWSYNPLDFIKRYEDGRICEKDVLTVAATMCPLTDHSEPIWDMCARSYIAFLIAYCLEALEPKEHNLVTVAQLHRQFSQQNGDTPFLLWIDKNSDSFAAKKYFEIMANRAADKMFASVMGFVNEALEPFTYREAEYIFIPKKKNINLHDLGNRKTALFVNTSNTDRTFDKIVDTVFSQIMQLLCRDADNTATGRLKVPVHIMLDDFACSGKIPDFDKIISVTRSRDISVSLILQSMSQLESIYDEKAAKTIMNNCDRWIYLGGQDMDTIQQIADRAGRTPESILCMPRDKEYLIVSGQKAVLVDKVKPYSTVMLKGTAPQSRGADEPAGLVS